VNRPVLWRVLWWVDLVLVAVLSLVLAALPVGLQFFGEQADGNDYLSSAITAAVTVAPVACLLVLAVLLRTRVGAVAAGVVLAGFVLVGVYYLAGVSGAPADRFGTGPDGATAFMVVLNPAALAAYVALVVGLVLRRRASPAQ